MSFLSKMTKLFTQVNWLHFLTTLVIICWKKKRTVINSDNWCYYCINVVHLLCIVRAVHLRCKAWCFASSMHKSSQRCTALKDARKHGQYNLPLQLLFPLTYMGNQGKIFASFSSNPSSLMIRTSSLMRCLLCFVPTVHDKVKRYTWKM